MAFAAPLLASLGAGSVVGGLATAGSLIGGVSSFLSGQYQAGVLRNQAAVADQNAARAIFAGQITQQDQDISARQAIDQDIAAQAASGLTLSSGTFARRRDSLRILARRDALRTRNDAEVQAQGLKAGASAARAEARQTSFGSFLSLIETGFNVKADLINSAGLVASSKAAQIRRDTLGVR
jgi:hypothetical protein